MRKNKEKHKTKYDKYKIPRTRKDLVACGEKKVPYCVEPARWDQINWFFFRLLSLSGTLLLRKLNMVKTCPKGLSFSFV